MTIITDIMLDLETLSTDPNAMVIAIGAVAYGAHDEEVNSFYAAIDIKYGALGTICPDTVAWWMSQSDEARLVFSKEMAVRTQAEALADFATWMHQFKGANVWGNGVDFDNVILRNCYKMHHMQTPWHYRQNRCYRTIKNMFPNIPYTRVGVHHNAVDDARTQGQHLMEIYKFANKLI